MTCSSSMLFKGLASLALLAAVGSNGFANTVTVDTNAFSDVYRGGEFTAEKSGLSTSSYSSVALLSGGFETFCMSYTEEFSPGNSYAFTTGPDILSTTLAPDPLSIGAAFLYSQFAKGTLAGYDYSHTGNGRVTDAGELQIALWWLQGEENGETGGNNQGAPGAGSGFDKYDSSNVFEKLAVDQFTGTLPQKIAKAMAAANGKDAVSVLILTTGSTKNHNLTYAQPQLYYNTIPDNGTTVVLVGLAFVGLVALRRRLSMAV